MDLCEFESSLIYKRLMQSKRETEPGGDTYLTLVLGGTRRNLSNRKVETGRDMAGRREEQKVEGDRISENSV